MILTENRFPLFEIMLQGGPEIAWKGFLTRSKHNAGAP